MKFQRADRKLGSVGTARSKKLVRENFIAMRVLPGLRQCLVATVVNAVERLF